MGWFFLDIDRGYSDRYMYPRQSNLIPNKSTPHNAPSCSAPVIETFVRCLFISDFMPPFSFHVCFWFHTTATLSTMKSNSPCFMIFQAVLEEAARSLDSENTHLNFVLFLILFFPPKLSYRPIFINLISCGVTDTKKKNNPLQLFTITPFT